MQGPRFRSTAGTQPPTPAVSALPLAKRPPASATLPVPAPARSSTGLCAPGLISVVAQATTAETTHYSIPDETVPAAECKWTADTPPQPPQHSRMQSRTTPAPRWFARIQLSNARVGRLAAVVRVVKTGPGR